MSLSPASFLTLLTLCLGQAPTLAEHSLHVQIDQHIAAQADARPASPLADDAQFLRRASLDLAGRIPSSHEVREFLRDTSPDKRTRCVDRLLASPDYPRRMQELAHIILMERRGDHPDWLAFLKASFEANKPLDQLVRELLNPDANNEATRASGFFLAKRLENYGQNPVDYPALTRDVGRLFLGIDLQCAQCHDHLFINEYKQRDYHGLFAFFQNISLRQGGTVPAVTEKLTKDKLEFQSVFNKEKRATGPRVPGLDEIEIPVFAKGEEYAEPPDPKTKSPGVPKFRPLEKLAAQLPTAENRAFTLNMANRLWAVLMGRGLVHPLDLHHGDNPPSHPELLELLARELADHRFDVKWLLRELALSETYQRSTRLPHGVDTSPPDRFLVAHEKYMSAEQLLWSVLQATGPNTPLAEPYDLPAGTTIDKLREKFVKAFANPPQEPEGEFAPSLRAALFMLNDPVVLECLKPRGGNLAARLHGASQPSELADELYRSVLSRPPTGDEQQDVARHLERHAARRSAAIEQLIWSLLASTEFSVNH